MTDQLRLAAQAALDVMKPEYYASDATAAGIFKFFSALAQQEVCELTAQNGGYVEPSCGSGLFYLDWDADDTKPPSYCPGCGKPIKFVEPGESR